MSENLTASQAPVQRRNAFATLAFLVTIAIILFQALVSILQIPVLGMSHAPFYTYFTYLRTYIERSLIALLLPMAALLLRNSNKPGKAKFFIPVSIIFFALQLICAIVLPILLRAGGSTQIFSSVAGSTMFNSLIAFFRLLFRGGFGNFRTLCTLLYHLTSSFVGLLYMIKHLLCLFAFIKIANAK